MRLKDVLKQILNNTLEVIEAADAGSIYLYDEAVDQLVPMVTGGFDWKYIKQIRFDPNESLTGVTFSRQEPMIFHNMDDVYEGMSTMSKENWNYFDLAVPQISRGVDAKSRSAMGCPFIIEGKCLGVITINNFLTEAQFYQDDLDLLEAICNQASLAIQRASLFQEIEHQVNELKQLNDSIHNKNMLMESASNTHEKLMQIMLHQKGIDEMISVIAELIGNPIVLYDAHINLLSTITSEELGFVPKMPSFLNKLKGIEAHKQVVRVIPKHFPITYPIRLHPIIVGNNVKGYLLIVEKNKKVKDTDQTTIEQSSAVIAIELLNRELVYDAEQRMKGEFLDDIDSNINVELIEKQGRYLGISERFHYHFIAIEPDRFDDRNLQDVKKNIQRLQKKIEVIILQTNPGNITFNRMYGMKALLGWNKDIDEDVTMKRVFELIDTIKQMIKRDFPDYSCSYAIGRLSRNWQEIQLSYQDISQCIEVFQKKQTIGTVMTYKETGLARIIMNSSPEELRQFVTDQMYPLLQYQHQNRNDLIKTLDVYLANNQHLKNTAESLHLHINTLHYRLKRIEEILDISLKGDLLQIKLAWSIIDILGKQDEWLYIKD